MIQKLGSTLIKLLPGSQRTLEREELTELLEESIRDTVTFDSHESMLLTNILGLRDIRAFDVMVPRADIVSVDVDDGAEAILGTMTAAGHSRVPVTKGSLDTVLGFLHIKDIARYLNDGNASSNGLDVTTLLRQPIFISPTMRALDLLQEMRVKRLHLALVVDEYGGTDGLITIEDLVEEIVGEINDEHDDDITRFSILTATAPRPPKHGWKSIPLKRLRAACSKTWTAMKLIPLAGLLFRWLGACRFGARSSVIRWGWNLKFWKATPPCQPDQSLRA